MRMTKREKLLVVFMLFFVAGYFLFQYVITPQRAGLSTLQANVAEWQEKKQALTAIDDKIAQLDQRKSEMETKIYTIGNEYFASLKEQEEAVVVLHELLRDTELKDLKIAFDEIEKLKLGEGSDSTQAEPDETANENAVAPMIQQVKLSYEGSYSALWNALRNFWNFPKYIQVSGVSIHVDQSNPDILYGDIELCFYDLSPLTLRHHTMVEWADDGAFRKINPFQSMIDQMFIGIRYVLNLNDEMPQNYVKFTDISGNWAETAIDDFGKRFLITADSENQFSPDKPMERDDLVVLLDRFFQWEAPTDPVDLTKFSDYAELGQSLSAMEKAFYKGYVMGCFVGYDDGTLRPNAPTSYQEFEIVMSRALEQPDFKWKDAALAIGQETGYTSPGINDASASITRAEVVYLLHSLPQT